MAVAMGNLQCERFLCHINTQASMDLFFWAALVPLSIFFWWVTLEAVDPIVIYLDELLLPDEAFSTAAVCDPLPDSQVKKCREGGRWEKNASGGIDARQEKEGWDLRASHLN